MAGELPEYLNWIRKQPCCKCGAARLVEAHHATNGLTHPPGEKPPPKSAGPKRGKGQKAHDWYAMPLCMTCHKKLHNKAGDFGQMSQQRFRAWQLEQVTQHRCLYEAQKPAIETEGWGINEAPLPPAIENEADWLDSLPF